jgi:hypothetical protein
VAHHALHDRERHALLEQQRRSGAARLRPPAPPPGADAARGRPPHGKGLGSALSVKGAANWRTLSVAPVMATYTKHHVCHNNHKTRFPWGAARMPLPTLFPLFFRVMNRHFRVLHKRDAQWRTLQPTEGTLARLRTLDERRAAIQERLHAAYAPVTRPCRECSSRCCQEPAAFYIGAIDRWSRGSVGVTPRCGKPRTPCAHLREHGCELQARLRPLYCVSYVCPDLARAMNARTAARVAADLLRLYGVSAEMLEIGTTGSHLRAARCQRPWR